MLGGVVSRRTLFMLFGVGALLLLSPSIGMLLDVALQGKLGAQQASDPPSGRRSFYARMLSSLLTFASFTPQLTWNPAEDRPYTEEQLPANITELITPSDIWEYLVAAKRSGDEMELSRLPKVALLFLTRGPLPFEASWRLFLEGMNAAVPGGLTWEDFFSVYVHAPPDFKYPDESLFANRIIEDRVHPVEWGQYNIIQAELNLMKAALADPRVQRMVLLSESCVPLYAAHVVWAQLMSERLSRINACLDRNNEADWQRVMAFRPHHLKTAAVPRWRPEMETDRLKWDHWRKSGQWIALTRAHAQIAVDDTHVSTSFRDHCWLDVENMDKGWQPRSYCIADEHYIPTLLASLGLENETDCRGSVTHAWWDGPYRHPRTHQSRDVDNKLLRILRGNEDDPPRCSVDRLIASAQTLFPWAQPSAKGAMNASDIVAVTALRQVSERKARNPKVRIRNPQLAARVAAKKRRREAQLKLSTSSMTTADSRRQLLESSFQQEEGKRSSLEVASRQLPILCAGSRCRRKLLAQPPAAVPNPEAEAMAKNALSSLEDRGLVFGKLLRGLEPITEPSCALFARKFDSASAQVLHDLSATYLFLANISSGAVANDSSGVVKSLRQLLASFQPDLHFLTEEDALELAGELESIATLQ